MGILHSVISEKITMTKFVANFFFRKSCSTHPRCGRFSLTSSASPIVEEGEGQTTVSLDSPNLRAFRMGMRSTTSLGRPAERCL